MNKTKNNPLLSVKFMRTLALEKLPVCRNVVSVSSLRVLTLKESVIGGRTQKRRRLPIRFTQYMAYDFVTYKRVRTKLQEKAALFEQSAERNGPDVKSRLQTATVDIDKTHNLALWKLFIKADYLDISYSYFYYDVVHFN